MPEGRSKTFPASAAPAAAAVCGIFFIAKWLLPLTLPFALALLTASATEPAVTALQRRAGLSRGLAAALCSLAVLSLAAAGTTVLIWRGIYELSAAARRLPGLLPELSSLLSSLDKRITGFIDSAPEELVPFLAKSVSGFKAYLAEVPAQISGALLNAATKLASAAPKTALFAATYAAATFFASSGYPEISGFLTRIVPKKLCIRLRGIKHSAASTLGAWLKAQAVLAGITFCVLLAVFSLLRIEYSVTLSLALAVLDTLPVLGTGTVLVPWAALELIRGRTARSALLVSAYVLCSLIRGLIEPKLIGRTLGLHPLASLFAMYAGFKTFGIMGMLLAPLMLLAAKQIFGGGLSGIFERKY